MLLKIENQDPRVQRTRRLLTQALRELLAEKDFHKITVGDITSRANVNRATFYAHFEDKQALINYSVQESFQEVLDSKLPADPTFTPDSLRPLALATCEFLEIFVDHCAPTERQNHAPLLAQVQARLYDVLLEWIEQSVPHALRSEPSPQMIAMATSWTIFGTAFQWAHETNRVSAAHIVDQLLPLLTEGLPAVNSSPASGG